MLNAPNAIAKNPQFEERLAARTLSIGVIGLGYVGLPLTHAFWRAGLNVGGFDIDQAKIDKLSAGESYINHFAATSVRAMKESGRFFATDDFSRLSEMDAI